MATFGAGFNFATPATATPASTASGGFAFATSTPATAVPPTGGFNFGAPVSAVPATQKTAIPTGFALGVPAVSTATNLPFGISATTNSAPTGLALGQAPAATTGFSLGGTGTSGVGLLGSATTASVAPSFGFSKPLAVGVPAATSFGLGGGLKLGTTATTLAPTLGSLGSFGVAGGAAPAIAGSIFGQSAAKTASSGLGGVDPKTATSTTATDSGKPGESKTTKETIVESSILLDVDELRKFVKEEKGEMEQMKRMSSTSIIKVQEDNAALKQLLSVVSSGLQKNAYAVDKLKKEMTQELKNAEMAVRTKEMPPGLQYENTAPTMYFQNVIENFETQMLTYRQQIETLENHLSSLHHPSRLTPEELVLLLRKLHEAFVSMASQLQQIHESVKTQKEHYLNYRKVFHGDDRNIFERQKKAPVKVAPKTHSDMYGQPPFPGVNNAAAVAMATALNRTPQPAVGAPPVTGFSNIQPTTGFGASAAGFGTGTSIFGAGTGTSGFGTAPGLFGNTSNLATTPAGSLFSSTVPGITPQLNLSTATEQPFQLNKPPVGSKRGKR